MDFFDHPAVLRIVSKDTLALDEAARVLYGLKIVISTPATVNPISIHREIVLLPTGLWGLTKLTNNVVRSLLDGKYSLSTPTTHKRWRNYSHSYLL